MAGPHMALKLFVLALCMLASASAAPTFYDALKADPTHKMIMQAVDGDATGKIKAMLQQQLPVTALVPTDTAFIVAGLKYKMGSSPADMQKVMANTCLIEAILKQHIVVGVYSTTQLASMYSKPSMLITKKYDAKAKKNIDVTWPLKFKKNAAGAVTVTSAAMDPKTNKPAINGTIVAPMNVPAGKGMLHNINQLMLPTTNITRLLQITGYAAKPSV